MHAHQNPTLQELQWPQPNTITSTQMAHPDSLALHVGRAGGGADAAAALTTRDNAIVQAVNGRPVTLRGVTWRGFATGSALDGLTTVLTPNTLNPTPGQELHSQHGWVGLHGAYVQLHSRKRGLPSASTGM